MGIGDKISNKTEELKGEAKESYGDATGDDARADERSLVAAGGWGAPSQSEEAPF